MAKAAAAPPASTLRIKLIKSPIGYDQRQKDTVRSLGLRRMNQIVEHEDSPAVRGMVRRVNHLVRVMGDEA